MVTASWILGFVRRMPRHAWVATACAALGWVSGPVYAEPVDDERLDEARLAFDAWLDVVAVVGSTESQMASQAEALLRGIAIRDLSAAQLERVARMISHSPRLSREAQAYADDLADDESADGAIALTAKAAIEMYATDGFPKPSQVNAILQHPGLTEALRNGHAREVFLMMRQISGWGLHSSKPFILELHHSLADDADPETVWYWMNMYPSVVRFTPDNIELRETIRNRLSSALDRALEQARAGGDDPTLEQRLTERAREFAGHWGRGTLNGVAAPELRFEHKPQRFRQNTLEDFRGRVVILDFFTTWATPSVESFVPLRRLMQRYRGYDVQVIGLTSLQGRHLSEATMIDTTDDPDLEHELMIEFIRDNRVEWPVVFSSHSVLDRAYGVFSFPHVTIVDTEGVVRLNGLDLRRFGTTDQSGQTTYDLQPVTDVIDQALRDGGRRAPR